MSGDYASRLTKGVNYGKCGLPEVFDTERQLTVAINRLVKLIKKSTYMVAHTGAGISTSAGLPDFRGKDGAPLIESLFIYFVFCILFSFFSLSPDAL
jgi:mono-ADP-ribosyltransferase sirtuin 6